MPHDSMTNRNRWSFLTQHQQNFGTYLPGLTGAWDLQGVSDSYYFTDLNNSLAAMSQSALGAYGSAVSEIMGFGDTRLSEAPATRSN